MSVTRKDLELLRGSIDTHCHAMPSVGEGIWLQDVFELAREGDEFGLDAICVKYHFGSSAGQAYLANKYAGAEHCKIIGGVTLNRAAGGWNPEAVRILAQDAHLDGFRSGRIVWFPERDALGDAKILGKPDLHTYLSPFCNQKIEDGLLPEVVEILEIVAKEDLCLALSHTSPEESLALIPEARRLGVKHIVATHASGRNVGWTFEQEKRGAELGVIFEESVITWTPAMRIFGYDVIDAREQIIEHIRAIGPEHYCISSDCGYVQGATPVEAMRIFIAMLIDEGFTDAEIQLMTRTNAARLLGLD
ncbi:MAG: hypothetical protein JWP17_740 [Solirubrobacterales bacterium]|jgi:hypothetical protein|nr:hypothetical protein [Solirubrobacterales bacterium]